MNELAAFIAEQLREDVADFSSRWNWLVVPLIYDFVMFAVKWTFLTAPVWLPMSIFAHVAGRVLKGVSRRWKEDAHDILNRRR